MNCTPQKNAPQPMAPQAFAPQGLAPQNASMIKNLIIAAKLHKAKLTITPKITMTSIAEMPKSTTLEEGISRMAHIRNMEDLIAREARHTLHATTQAMLARAEKQTVSRRSEAYEACSSIAHKALAYARDNPGAPSLALADMVQNLYVNMIQEIILKEAETLALCLKWLEMDHGFQKDGQLAGDWTPNWLTPGCLHPNRVAGLAPLKTALQAFLNHNQTGICPTARPSTPGKGR